MVTTIPKKKTHHANDKKNIVVFDFYLPFYMNVGVFWTDHFKSFAPHSIIISLLILLRNNYQIQYKYIFSYRFASISDDVARIPFKCVHTPIFDHPDKWSFSRLISCSFIWSSLSLLVVLFFFALSLSFLFQINLHFKLKIFYLARYFSLCYWNGKILMIFFFFQSSYLTYNKNKTKILSIKDKCFNKKQKTHTRNIVLIFFFSY